MGLKEILQTLEDRSNPDEVENHGPFMCNNNPWLGRGYYFWDTFLELAHWWGKQGYKGNYIICHTHIDDNINDVLDFVGNTKQLIEFSRYAEALKKDLGKEYLTVPFVIEHMKRTIRNFPYKAIRANPIGSTGGDKYLQTQKMSFKGGNPAYLELIPPIQICIIDKSILGNNQFKVIYPETYCEDYTV